MKKRILFLMSDTGGGHRATAEAIRDGLFARYGKERIDAELIDVFKRTHFPMNYMPELYPWIINHGKKPWEMAYDLSNTRRRAEVVHNTLYVANHDRFVRLARNHQVDVVVCVHPMIGRSSLRAWQTLEKRPPFLTVVTDLVSTHMFWYDQQADLTMVPTQAAFDRGLRGGIPSHKLKITGLPVNPRFNQGLIGQSVARKVLGWNPEKITILMVSGREGMGPIYETAQAINAMHLDCQLVVVAGRNEALKAKLDNTLWNQPTRIYPLVNNMPQMMDAADIIVTKAGPSTITEAAIAGLPMILMDAIPGQEEGNVTYVVENDAGAWAPQPEEAANVVARWISGGKPELRRRSECARRVARPQAIWDVVDEVMHWAEQEPFKNPHRKLWQRARDFVTLSR